MAALTLRGGAATAEETKAINERAKGPSHEHWVRFLESLYPGRPTEEGAARYLAALDPDLLGEQLITRVLAERHTPTSYLLDVFNDNDPEALRQAFVVLGRISLRDQRALGWMQHLLTEDVNGRAPAAFLAAMTLGKLSAYGELGRMLAAQLDGTGTEEVAALIERLAPEQTVSLRELCAWATRRLLQAIPAGQKDEDNLKQRARLLNNLGNRLSELGRREEALNAAREAVRLYLKVAESVPARYLRECVGAARGLAQRCEESGRDRRAEPILAEAAALVERFTPKEGAAKDTAE